MPSCLKSNSVAQRKISEVALRQLRGQEERIKNPGPVIAERESGRLHRSEDPFRAVRPHSEHDPPGLGDAHGCVLEKVANKARSRRYLAEVHRRPSSRWNMALGIRSPIYPIFYLLKVDYTAQGLRFMPWFFRMFLVALG